MKLKKVGRGRTKKGFLFLILMKFRVKMVYTSDMDPESIEYKNDPQGFYERRNLENDSLNISTYEQRPLSNLEKLIVGVGGTALSITAVSTLGYTIYKYFIE